MASVLTINGSAVDRVASRVTLGALTLATDEPEELTFTELRAAGGTGSWSAGQSCALSIDGTPYFAGIITSAHPSPAGGGAISVAYTAVGLRWLVNDIRITASDGTGAMSWNLPNGDPDYLPSLVGQTVGQIVRQILDQHTTQLAAVGLTASPPYSAGELAAMTVVPNEPVVASGRLLDACADLIATWCPKYAIYPAAADARIHVVDTTTLAATTLTLDSDPITLDGLSKSHAECYTQVTLRGAADVQGAYLQLSDTTIEFDQTPAQQAAWTIADFLNPRNAADHGDITAMSSTTLTVQSSDASRTWGVNYWNSIGATVWAINPVATGINYVEQARIASHPALTAGGTCVLTLDHALTNSGYTKYQIRGQRTDMSLVWRKLKINPTYVARHLVRRFPHSIKWAPTDGFVTQTMTPMMDVCWSQSGNPPYFEWPVDFEMVITDGTSNGYLIANQPIPSVYASQAQLTAGGSAVPPPSDIKVLLPYSRGTLTATVPAGSYEGTAYTVDGIQRTLIVDYPQWVDSGDFANMLLLAREKLDSVKDTVIEGQVSLYAKTLSWLTLGKALNIARAGGSTGLESLAAPVRSVSIDFQHPSTPWVMRLRFTTRRRPFTGDRLYAPRPYAESAGRLGGDGDTSPAAFRALAMGSAGLLAAGADPAAAAAGAFGGVSESLGVGPGSEGTPYVPEWAAAGPGANTYRGGSAAERDRRKAQHDRAEAMRHDREQSHMPDRDQAARQAQHDRAEAMRTERARRVEAARHDREQFRSPPHEQRTRDEQHARRVDRDRPVAAESAEDYMRRTSSAGDQG